MLFGDDAEVCPLGDAPHGARFLVDALASPRRDAFASAVLRIHGSQELFASLWRAALAHTQAHLSAAHQQQVLCSLVRCPGGAAAALADLATPPARDVSAHADRAS